VDSPSDVDDTLIIVISIIVSLIVLLILVLVLVVVLRVWRLRSRAGATIELEVRKDGKHCCEVIVRTTVSLRMSLLSMQLEGVTLDRCTKVSGKEQLKLL
jgi:uncharacterized protein (DUF58 family)